MSFPVAILTRSCDARDGGWPSDLRLWLGSAELEEYAILRHPPRRTEWVAGRWLLKKMLHQRLTDGPFAAQPDPLDITILSRDGQGRSAAPRALINGRALAGHISLAHHQGIVWAAFAASAETRVGIDVVPARPVEQSLSAHWYTPREREWLDRSRDPLLGAGVWAAKEAVYKATNHGEPFAPAQYEIDEPLGGRWTWTANGRESTLEIRYARGQIVASASASVRPTA
jgi:phosphopantetheinyl transferase (holo-ACP synthase)